MRHKWLARSPRETIECGKRLAKQLKAGDVVALTGDLGAGKTTLVKGLAMGLGLSDPDEVKSPTYVIMHVYRTKIPLYHFDLYRLGGGEDLDAIGFEDFIDEQGTISCIEWAERAKTRLPKNTVRVSLKSKGERVREIRVQKPVARDKIERSKG